ncbi:hypothetical protein FJ364_00660 [Candidatus Dependentiae bacterium]|nr:hypothetical protein [Candidatus Dependentiae bacterium]
MKGMHEVSMSPVIQSFIKKLDMLATQNFPHDGIDDLFKNHPFDVEFLEPYVFFSDNFYTRNLLHKKPAYELLLLCWMPNQKSPIHGHEGEKCWMRVESGKLHFTDYSVKEIGEGVIVEPRYTIEGECGFVDGPAVIHHVENKANVPAYSLHLYARPFAQCDIFDLENRLKKRAELGYDSMYGKLTSARHL